MTVAAGCVPYEPDMGCVTPEEWADYTDELRERATALAWAAMRHLTGGLVGNCPVLIRPCRRGCTRTDTDQRGPGWSPVIRDGAWYNIGCGCTGDCSCGELCEVEFPGYVAAIGGVWLGGAQLDRTAYRVDNGRLLVRQDGDCWPLCQDMSQPWDGEDAFSVVYVPGVWPGVDGLWAAGILAAEFAKACSGGKCRLPSSVTALNRQGVSMEFSEGMFAGGNTGIREVDAYILSVNPHHLSRPSLVWSPDIKQARWRMTTFTGAPIPPTAGPFSWDFSPDFVVSAP